MRASLTAAVVVGLVGCSAGCSQSVSPTAPSLGLSSTRALDVPVTSAAVARQAVPFTGTLEGVYTLAFTGPTALSVTGHGAGNGTHLGRFTFDYDEIVDLSTATGTGTYEFIAANGDRLSSVWAGVGLPTSDPNVLSVIEDATITRGTGRFVGAAGTFRVERLFNFATASGRGSFAGTIELR